MNINRHNYEEYFILYMDNELGNDDRRQVEEFVQKHPDLKEELEIFLQYKMAPDSSIVYNEKEELMMPQINSSLNMDNYEEWLVLYMDNELTAEQKTTADQFISDYPSVKEELVALQRTQLQPEKIVFANKETLYKRTTDRPVVIMNWWRVAAAILILVIGTAIVIMPGKKPSPGNDIVTIPGNEQKIKKESPVANKDSENKNDKQTGIARVVSSIKQTDTKVASKHNNGVDKKQQNNLPVIKKEEPVIANNNQQPSNNLPKPLNNSINKDAFNKSIADFNPKENQNLQQKTDNHVTTDPIPPSYTSNKSSANDDELNQSGGKKSKLRGFLRKVTRTFEKTTNIDPADDENRVLVGGLAFKLN